MDARDRAANTPKWYQRLDQKRMVAIVEDPTGETDDTREIPIKFEVCPLCRGKGTHVNPSIDAHGITRDEFDEDPDFAEDYHSGMYDVDCYECDGRRVVPVPVNDADQAELDDRLADQAAYLAECEAERRMGA